MTTQKAATKAIKGGGRIHNNILLNDEGKPIGTLNDSQISNLIEKQGFSVSTGYDQTITVQ